MNNEDMSEIIQKISNMMNNNQSNNEYVNDNDNDMSFDSTEIPYNVQDILNNFNSSNNENNESSNYKNNTDNFNLDFETIMKIKKVMDAMQSTKNSPESNLLLSLKPYLNNNRKQKLEQYIQFLNISKVIEAFNNNGGVNNK